MVNTENTPRHDSSQAQTVKIDETTEPDRPLFLETIEPVEPFSLRLRGIPKGVLTTARAIQDELNISPETWKLWRDAKMRTILDKGTNAELVFTDDVIKFLLSSTKIGMRPSTARKRATAERKREK